MAGVTTYTPELAETICIKLMEGESLLSICKKKDMPSASTVYKWLLEIPEFSDNYARAREAQAERYADEIIGLADDTSRDLIPFSGAIERSKLQVDARKWIASKLLPKKYGSFKAIEVKGELETKQADLSHLSFEQLYELKHGRKPE